MPRRQPDPVQFGEGQGQPELPPEPEPERICSLCVAALATGSSADAAKAAQVHSWVHFYPPKPLVPLPSPTSVASADGENFKDDDNGDDEKQEEDDNDVGTAIGEAASDDGFPRSASILGAVRQSFHFASRRVTRNVRSPLAAWGFV